jgi:hypothetical protein
MAIASQGLQENGEECTQILMVIDGDDITIVGVLGH